jgi:hypothetical protein
MNKKKWTGFYDKGFGCSNPSQILEELVRQGIPSRLAKAFSSAVEGNKTKGLGVLHNLSVEEYPYVTGGRTVYHQNKLLVLPNGTSNNLYSLGLGQEIIDRTRGYSEEILEEDVDFELPDGTVMRGQRIRREKYSGRDIENNPYFDISLNDGGTSYEVSIKSNAIKAKPPREFTIESYLVIGNKAVVSRKETQTIGRVYNSTDLIPPVILSKQGKIRKL